MSAEFSQHSDQINGEARDWFLLVESGAVTEQQHEQLTQWLAASNEHLDAYQQLKIICDDLAELSTSAEGAALRQSVETGFTGRILADFMESMQRFSTSLTFGLGRHMAMAVTAVAFVAGALYLSQPAAKSYDVYATHIGEIKTITLDDGSQVTLGANTTVKSWSDDDERQVVLKTGQAFFVVTRDPERPFRVDTEDTRVEVVGTQFDVRSTLGRVRVAVLEGVVNVTSVEPAIDRAGDATDREDMPALVLTAGQQVIKPRATGFQPIKTITEQELSAWRQGRLVYRNASLVDVIGDANRYFDGTIALEGVDLSDLRVTAAIRTDQVEFLPDMLAQSLPIVVRKSGDNKIVISPRDVK